MKEESPPFSKQVPRQVFISTVHSSVTIVWLDQGLSFYLLCWSPTQLLQRKLCCGNIQKLFQLQRLHQRDGAFSADCLSLTHGLFGEWNGLWWLANNKSIFRWWCLFAGHIHERWGSRALLCWETSGVWTPERRPHFKCLLSFCGDAYLRHRLVSLTCPGNSCNHLDKGYFKIAQSAKQGVSFCGTL